MRGRATAMTYNYKGAARYKRPLLAGPPPGTSLDATFSAIRRVRQTVRRYKRCPTSKDIAKGKENYFAVQDDYRGQAASFTNLLLGTLKAKGYRAYHYSPSNYLMFDTEVVVIIDGYEVQVWCHNANCFYTVIESNAYSYYDVPLSLVPYLEGSKEDKIPIYTIDGLLRRLATFREALEAHHYCRTCYYSTEGGRYCGLGADPVGCTHYYKRGEITHDTVDVDVQAARMVG